LPNALIDSVNYNLPPISSKCSGAEDILGKSYKNFTNRNDYNQLSNLMINMINNYTENLKELKKIKKKLNRFLIKTQSLKYLDYCVEILNKK
jgi:predicted patatin/cPLA2 family phospholipase